MDALDPGNKISLWLDAVVVAVLGVVLTEREWTFLVLRLWDGTHIAMTPEALEAHTSAYEAAHA